MIQFQLPDGSDGYVAIQQIAYVLPSGIGCAITLTSGKTLACREKPEKIYKRYQAAIAVDI